MLSKLLSLGSLLLSLLKGSNAQDVAVAALQKAIAAVAKANLSADQKSALKVGYIALGKTLYSGNDAALAHLTALAAQDVFAMLPPGVTIEKLMAAAKPESKVGGINFAGNEVKSVS